MSPGNEVNIASDSEVQQVISFLSGDASYDSHFERQHKQSGSMSGEEGLQQRQGDYPYLYDDEGHVTDYHNGGRYEGMPSGEDGLEREWSRPTSADQPNLESPTPGRSRENDVALSERGDSVSGGGMMDGYKLASGDVAAGSVSTSPRVKGEELRGGESPDPGADNCGGRGEGDQRYSQHHNSPKKKGDWERSELPHSDSSGRDPQELSLVFSKGFGQLISSEPGRSGGMDLLHNSVRMLDRMNDEESDSERSGYV